MGLFQAAEELGEGKGRGELGEEFGLRKKSRTESIEHDENEYGTEKGKN